MNTTPILSAQKIYKKINDTSILQGIDIDLQRGEILAITGPSGSGKSTLLHCLAGITNPDTGTIVYNEMNLNSLDQNAKTKLRTTDFGFIFQFGELVPELTVIDNVALPLLLSGTKKKEAYKIAAEWIEQVEISHVSKSLPHVLSGGEVQRVAFARAMAIDPKIIFADEPTGSLDTINTTKVMDLLVSLAHQHQKSVMLITHSEQVAAYADRVVTILDGQIDKDIPTMPS